jgi:hypothetical protein
MAVGLPAKTTYVDGDVFSASDINDTNGTLNLVGQTQNFYAGKNKIINGDFAINQRGFSSSTTTGAYGFDRWRAFLIDGTTNSYSAQTFTPGSAPITGYEATNFVRLISAGQTLTTAQTSLRQSIESVRTFAAQTITVSFWAKAATGTPKVALEINQGFGSPGSSDVDTYGGQVTLSTSWERYSLTVSVPSISGKTIGSSNYLQIILFVSAGSNFNARTGSLGIQSNTFDIWGVQVEAGSTATAFQTATGTIQGELAACQRYYVRYNASASGSNAVFAPSGMTIGTTISVNYTALPVELRVYPLSVDFGGSLLVASTTANVAVTAVTLQDRSNTKIMSCTYTVASGLTTNTYSIIRADSSTSAFLGFSAEF